MFVIAASLTVMALGGATALAIGRSSASPLAIGSAQCIDSTGDQVLVDQQGLGVPPAPSNELTSVALHADSKTLTAVFNVSGPVEHGDGLDALPGGAYAYWQVNLFSTKGKPLYHMGVHQDKFTSSIRVDAHVDEPLSENELSGYSYRISGQQITISEPLKMLSSLGAHFKWSAGSMRVDGTGTADSASRSDSCPRGQTAGGGSDLLDFPQKAALGAASSPTTSAAASKTTSVAASSEPLTPFVPPTVPHVVTAPASPDPALGRPWGPYQQGYGLVKPATINNGGDPTGLVTDVHWDSWGGSQAIGQGTTTYVSGNQGVANGTQERATVVAFNVGMCQGKLAYQAIEWYFPQHGQSFNRNQYINICTGDYVGQ